jgi:methionyl-tRNA synthetase
MSIKRFTITAALPYANGPLHIGHLAGAYLPADIFVRHQRLHGHEVAFICGSDEHGAAITLRARKEGITPQEIIDKYHGINQVAFKQLGIDFDVFDRTSAEHHKKTASDFFLKLAEKGVFTEEVSDQFFDPEFNVFLADRYITGTCPVCAHPSAYGDQCEKCGSTLNPNDLGNPISTLSGATPIKKPTKHWYLPMQDHEAWIKAWIETGDFPGREFPIQTHVAETWKSNVRGQCQAWLKEGLRPRAMTRDLDWGVPVPLPGAEGKVLYVWLDAPIGYISATKAWAKEKGEPWEKWWTDPDTKLIHFIGKDNIVFHCIIFPMLLKAHGGFILPDNVPANEFLNLEGQKISTSRNHAVWLHEYLTDLPEREDELRYVLTSIAPETGDSEFTWKDYQTRVNSELVAVLGNLIHRVLILHHKYFEGKLQSTGQFSDEKLHAQVGAMYDALDQSISQYKFRQGLQDVMELARFGNRYLTENEPWKRFATNPNQVRVVLEDMVRLIAHLGAGLQPYLPFSSKKIFSMLGLPKTSYGWHTPIEWEVGHTLNTPEILFRKIEDTDVQAQMEKLEAMAQAAVPTLDTTAETNQEMAVAPTKETITYEDFARIDLRVGTILAAERVPKADKLLKLTLEVGVNQRTVVSGIAAHYTPEEIVGKQVCVLINLAPRKLRGIESEGMILMAEQADGKLVFMSPENLTQPGAVIA